MIRRRRREYEMFINKRASPLFIPFILSFLLHSRRALWTYWHHLVVRDPVWGNDWSHSLFIRRSPCREFPWFFSAVRQIPEAMCTAPLIISLSLLSLATDVTDATLAASGLWLGIGTWATGTATLTESFFGRSPWLHGQLGGIYFTAEENPGELQLEELPMKAVLPVIASNGVPYLQKTSVIRQGGRRMGGICYIERGAKDWLNFELRNTLLEYIHVTGWHLTLDLGQTVWAPLLIIFIKSVNLAFIHLVLRYDPEIN